MFYFINLFAKTAKAQTNLLIYVNMLSETLPIGFAIYAGCTRFCGIYV